MLLTFRKMDMQTQDKQYKSIHKYKEWRVFIQRKAIQCNAYPWKIQTDQKVSKWWITLAMFSAVTWWPNRVHHKLGANTDGDSEHQSGLHEFNALARRKTPVWPSPSPKPSPVTTEIRSISFPAPVSASSCIGPTSSASGCSATAVWLHLGRGRFGPQSLYFLGAARKAGIGQDEMWGVGLRVKVTVCQSGTHCQPA